MHENKIQIKAYQFQPRTNKQMGGDRMM